MTFARRNARRLPSYLKPGPRKYGSPSYSVYSTGFGYLNRITRVVPIESNPYLVAEITALSGDVRRAKKINFGAIVSEKQPRQWMRFLANDVDEGREVLVRFRMSDLVNQFTDPDDPSTGLRTQLISIDAAQVDGQDVSLSHRP